MTSFSTETSGVVVGPSWDQCPPEYTQPQQPQAQNVKEGTATGTTERFDVPRDERVSLAREHNAAFVGGLGHAGLCEV